MRRRKRAFFWLMLACWASAVVWLLLRYKHIVEWMPLSWVSVSLCGTVVMSLGYGGAKYELQTGQRFPWSSLFG